MLRMATTSLKFHRLDLSPYQAESFPSQEIELLNNLGITHTDDYSDAQILISNTHTDFSKLTNLKNTELLIHPNSGYDNIPCSFVADANFPILTGNPIRANGVTEYTLGRLFEHFSSIDQQDKWVSGRLWPRKRLADQSVLIVGYGHIGKLLESSLRALTKELHIYDPYESKPELKAEGIDVVLLAASLNSKNHKMIDADFLEKLNPGWVLINGARGKLIDQTQLLKALQKDKQAYAYIDVFENEPFADNEFESVSNLKSSSHIAGVSANLDQLILDFEYKLLNDFITHRPKSEEFNNLYANLLLKNKLSPDNSFLI